MADIEKLANILGAETIKRIYEDGLSGTVQEVGKLLTDIAKTLRLVSLPFQVGADIQERLTRQLNRVREAVPDERQQQAPAHLAGPIIERLKYLEDYNYLTDLYLNLLKRAIDKERVNEAHPAFFHIIDQLSPDEAFILWCLSVAKFTLNTQNRYEFYTKEGVEETMELMFPQNFDMYISHLQSLNLVKNFKVTSEKFGIFGHINTDLFQPIELSEFGKQFVKACIPETGFNFSTESRPNS